MHRWMGGMIDGRLRILLQTNLVLVQLLGCTKCSNLKTIVMCWGNEAACKCNVCFIKANPGIIVRSIHNRDVIKYE